MRHLGGRKKPFFATMFQGKYEQKTTPVKHGSGTLGCPRKLVSGL